MKKITIVIAVVVILVGGFFVYRFIEGKANADEIRKALKEYALGYIDGNSNEVAFIENTEDDAYEMLLKTESGVEYSVMISKVKGGSFENKDFTNNFVLVYGDYLFKKEPLYKEVMAKLDDNFMYNAFNDGKKQAHIFEEAKKQDLSLKAYMDQNREVLIKENVDFVYIFEVEPPVEDTSDNFINQHYDRYVENVKTVDGFPHHISLYMLEKVKNQEFISYSYTIHRNKPVSKGEFKQLFLDFDSKKVKD